MLHLVRYPTGPDRDHGLHAAAPARAPHWMPDTSCRWSYVTRNIRGAAPFRSVALSTGPSPNAALIRLLPWHLSSPCRPTHWPDGRLHSAAPPWLLPMTLRPLPLTTTIARCLAVLIKWSFIVVRLFDCNNIIIIAIYIYIYIIADPPGSSIRHSCETPLMIRL